MARHQDTDGLSSRWRRVAAAGAVLALLWVLAARVSGPSDAWDQSQPFTTACTTDIIVNGHWILPAIWGGQRATKPPLYNWLAVPAVRVLGFSSDPGHRMPSVLALVGCWLAVAALGRWLGGAACGWLAAMMLVANYTFFKLGYLARPDMVLTLWLLLGWTAATWLLASAPRSSRAAAALAFVFWACTGLAALTKGPAALVLPVYALVASRVIGGGWRAANVLRWWWGAPLAVLMFGAWAWVAWTVDADHMRHIWWNEVAGRITGLGSEGGDRGPAGMLIGAPNMALYYLGYFAPWSVLSVVAVWALWRRPAPAASRLWRALGARGGVLTGAALFVIVTIVLHSLSASKRADYGAAAYAPGALLAAWALLHGPGRIGLQAPWLALAVAFGALVGFTVHGRLEVPAPQRGFGNAIERFIHDAEAHMRADPAPVAFWVVDCAHLPGYLGLTRQDDAASVSRFIDTGRPFWLLAGGPERPRQHVRARLRETRLGGSLTMACRSDWLTWNAHWPGRVILFRVDPGRPRPSAGSDKDGDDER